LVWGQREYVNVREYFIRSPVRFNGVTLSESQRQKCRGRFSETGDHAPGRQRRQRANAAQRHQSFIKQTREPEFISSAYFFSSSSNRALRPGGSRDTGQS
jgi:hypothetical protein